MKILKLNSYGLTRLGVIRKRRPHEWGRQEEAGMGRGGQGRVDIHIWFKIFVFNCSITVRIMTPESINIYCN